MDTMVHFRKYSSTRVSILLKGLRNFNKSKLYNYVVIYVTLHIVPVEMVALFILLLYDF